MATTTDTPDWLARPITDDEIAACRAAGASDAFLTMLRTDHPDGGRHSVRAELKKQLRKWGNDPAETTRLAGGFYNALWDGQDYQYRADSNNKAILQAAGLID
jgi:hypothetical protein